MSKKQMLHTSMAVVASLLVCIATATAADSSEWKTDLSIYGLLASMSGEIGVGPVTADVDVGFDDILENLEMGGMAKIRTSNDKWSFALDVIYMGLGASKNRVNANVDQLVVEPSVGYQATGSTEFLVGVRYTNVSGELHGPGVLPVPRIPTLKQDWFDPFIGFNTHHQLSTEWSFDFRTDIGGFGVGSDIVYQIFPSFSWQFSESASMQLGYRWVDYDFEDGDGRDRFAYDMLIQGAQVGVTFRF